MPDYETKDSGEREQYASGMQRDTTTGKIRWHLIASGPMLRRWAELMTRGADKYDDDNWTKANSEVEYNRFKASAFRHFMQWYNGDTDEDHGAAVMFNINGAEYTKDKLDAKPIITIYGDDGESEGGCGDPVCCPDSYPEPAAWDCGIRGCPDAKALEIQAWEEFQIENMKERTEDMDVQANVDAIYDDGENQGTVIHDCPNCGGHDA